LDPKDLVFSATKYGTATQLGFKNDLEYVRFVFVNGRRDHESILRPSKSMKPDLLYFIKSSKEVWYAISFNIKLYTSHFNNFKEAVESTDLSMVYSYIEKGTKLFYSDAKIFHEITSNIFNKNGSAKVIRINVIIAPNITKDKCTSNMKSLCNENEICVFITKDNLEDLFDIQIQEMIKLAIEKD